MEKENKKQLAKEIEELRIKLKEAEDTINAIRNGEVDAIVVSGMQGEQVFTLTGAERAYRVLIETMNEGAASLNQEGIIIYCNHRLSEMLKTPLEKVIGAPMRQFIRASDLPVFDSFLKKGAQENGKGEVALINSDGTMLPVLLSISALQKDNADIYGITCTDLTAQKHIEDELARHRDHFEELVKVRTNELETSNQQLRDEITERKKIENALRESEEKYRTLVENIPQKIFTKDKRSGYVSCNENYARDLGIRPEEIVGKTDFDFFPKELADNYRADDMRLMESGETEGIEEQYIHGGEKAWIYTVKTPIRDKAGNTVGILGVFSDITDRKRTEDALRESEKRFRQIAESTEEWIWEVNNDGLYTYSSHVVEKILGYTPEEIVGKKHFYDFFPFDMREQMKKEVFEGFASKRPFIRYVNMNAHKNGSIITLETSGSPILDCGGGLLGYRGVDVDITERKKAEDRLVVLNQAIEALPVGVTISDLEGKILYSNPFEAETHGYTVDELIGGNARIFSPEENWRPINSEELSSIEVWKRETVNIKKSGEVFPVYLISLAVRTSDGKPIGIVTACEDLTERQKLEDQLRQAQKMEAVGTLAGGIAHDFNNILNVIIGFGTMVMDRMGDDPLSKEQMNEVLIAAERAATLTKRLLIFTRKQVVEVKPVKVNELILGLQKMLVRIIKESIDFTLHLADSPMMILADAGQIEQVLINLVSNARDAMMEGGRLTIGTGIKELDEEYVAAYGYGKPGRYALITVADTGQGMDEETKKKIFEPFFTTKGIGDGTGLGLAISYGIIKQHNGYIRVYSELGKGTEFKIYLPLIEDSAVLGKKTEATVSAKGGNETILVAEDDASLRKLSRIVLESYGYTVITAEDGEDAITKFMENRERISLALIDMIMPKKNGKEVVEVIRQVSPRTKILFASGYTMDIIMTKELTESGFDFILKPVLPKDLLKKVRELLDR